MADAAVPNLQPTTDVTRLSGFLASIGSFSEDMILFFNQSETLYHYTSLDGLLAIVEGEDLRLTHARYCNDEAELTHGLDLARTVISDELKSAQGKRRDYLEELQKLMQSVEIEPAYICCFCNIPDRLSQWRAYGANGTGVCMEFHVASFSYITGLTQGAGLMRFWKVFYGVETQQKIIRSAINYYPTNEPASTHAEWAQWTMDAIRFFIPSFKHQDFVEEEEWRLIFTPSPTATAQLSHRTSRGMLIPYYCMKDIAQSFNLQPPKLPLRSVRIGPNPNRLLNNASIRMLLDKKGYQSTEIKASQATYRGS
jgi:Protein of unknown function (DUF2971)